MNSALKLEEIKKTNPFKVPEGYFENLTTHILSQLPEKNEKEIRTPSLWERMQPWVYMAAMFTGIMLMVRLFVGSPPNLDLNSSADIEAFYQYYEEQLTGNLYHETLFPDDTALLEDDEY
ncbi:MAG: hypothetical protein LBP72_00265 [Dysgonamonadaceae bacterium]|jgi:hypothetical protein|nr:hypothetical protein [Dysgonamonadaceae bacterium]